MKRGDQTCIHLWQCVVENYPENNVKIKPFALKCLFTFSCVVLRGKWMYTISEEWRSRHNLLEGSYLFPPCGFWGINLRCQAWQQAVSHRAILLPFKPSFWRIFEPRKFRFPASWFSHLCMWLRCLLNILPSCHKNKRGGIYCDEKSLYSEKQNLYVAIQLLYEKSVKITNVSS